MAINSELDVTPAFTFTTLQTSSETVNTVINSLLAVLILVNIGSAVSKLVYFTRTKSFRYSSWVRAFIFANSDDPLRIISWLFRNYVYRDPNHNRFPNKRRSSRLFLPLLARAIIFVASIASIAITVPTERVLQGCINNDYELVYDPQLATKTRPQIPYCTDIPLKSDLGDVRTTAAYCHCIEFLEPNPKIPALSRVTAFADQDSGTVHTEFANETYRASYYFYVEWKAEKFTLPRTTFRSDLHKSLDMRVHTTLVLDAIRSTFSNPASACALVTPSFESGGEIHTDLDCTFQSVEIMETVEAYLRSAMEWRRIPRGRVQKRIEITTGKAAGSIVNKCPLDLVVNRPLVNMAPLAIIFVIWVLINLIVSFLARKHGNALDAGFHVIKEALGHDCTSNPLEESTEREEVIRLKCRKWRCSSGGAHVGFIGREGDVPVRHFHEKTIVCGCSRVAVELERATTLETAPVGFAAPGRESVSLASGQQNSNSTTLHL